MNAIVCVQQNPETKEWGIGYKNNLLFHYSDDKKVFKQQTLGGICIMGRKTFESLSGPLVGRINIVLTRNMNYTYNPYDLDEDATVIILHSYRELFTFLNNCKRDIAWDDDKIWVIGGEQIYFDLLPYCKHCVVTNVRNQEIKKADSFFPNLDELDNWKCKIIQVSDSEPLSFYYYINTDEKEYIL